MKDIVKKLVMRLPEIWFVLLFAGMLFPVHMSGWHLLLACLILLLLKQSYCRTLWVARILGTLFSVGCFILFLAWFSDLLKMDLSDDGYWSFLLIGVSLIAISWYFSFKMVFSRLL